MAAFGSASLVLDGPNGGVQANIDGSKAIQLGRVRENDVVILDSAASSHHCELMVEDGILVVRDLNSSNGTFVNGRRVDSCPLYDGDILRIGQSQGRITVVGEDGKPLRQLVSRGPVVAVAISVVVLVVVAFIGLMLWNKHRNEERDRFSDYESKAKVLLTESSPCEVASKIQLDFLQKHDDEIVHVDSGHLGHLTPEGHAKDEQVLTGSRQRAAQAADISAKLSKLTGERQGKFEELKKFETEFSDAELSQAVGAVNKVLGRQQEIAADFAKAWTEYAGVVKEENDLLAALLDAPNEKKGKEDADKLTARIGVVVQSPAQIHDACEQSYRDTREKGVSQLAHIAL